MLVARSLIASIATNRLAATVQWLDYAKVDSQRQRRLMSELRYLGQQAVRTAVGSDGLAGVSTALTAGDSVE